MLYRILTEDKGNDTEIASLVLRHYEGFNISKAIGYYKGKQEKTLIVEIETFKDSNPIGVYALAQAIRDYGKQECVLLQIFDNVSKLV